MKERIETDNIKMPCTMLYGHGQGVAAEGEEGGRNYFCRIEGDVFFL